MKMIMMTIKKKQMEALYENPRYIARWDEVRWMTVLLADVSF